MICEKTVTTSTKPFRHSFLMGSAERRGKVPSPQGEFQSDFFWLDSSFFNFLKDMKKSGRGGRSKMRRKGRSKVICIANELSFMCVVTVEAPLIPPLSFARLWLSGREIHSSHSVPFNNTCQVGIHEWITVEKNKEKMFLIDRVRRS